jgi:hypothetical protein
MTHDQFAGIQEKIKEAARQAFTEVRSLSPEQDFYVYALYSDDDGMTVMPSANTRAHQSSDPYHRWGSSEWRYCGAGGEYFNAVPIRGGDEAFRGKLFATMVLALKDLDADGFFGTGQERQQITLLCSVTDSADTAWVELESVRLLNPPAVYLAYRNDVEQIEGFVEHATESWGDPEGVYRHFHAHLEEAGLPVLPLKIVETPPQRAALQGHKWHAKCAAITTDGKLLATGTHQEPTIKLWDLVMCQERATLQPSDKVKALAFSPDGSVLASGSGEHVQLWDIGTLKELRTFRAHTAWINSLAFTPDGKTLVTGGADDEGGQLKTWDVARGSTRTEMEHTDETVLCVSVSPDGKTVAAVDDSIRLWDLASGKVRKTFPTTEEHRTGRATFTPDGKTLASCGFASDVRLWDVENGLEKAALKTGGSDPKQMVAVSRDGRFLAAACDDGILKLWSLQDGKLLISWKGDDMDVDFVLFTPDARTLISNGILPPIIKLWDVAKWTRP